MEFQQRVATPNETAAAAEPERRLWLAGTAGSPVEPVESDRYVVVDERDDGILVLIVALWPELDSLGRLAFSGSRKSVAVSEAELDDELDRRRQRSGHLRRPIRISDTFLVRGPVTKSPAKWPETVDVTALARSHAKMAFHAAVAPKKTAQEARSVKLETPAAKPELPAAAAEQVARPEV